MTFSDRKKSMNLLKNTGIKDAVFYIALLISNTGKLNLSYLFRSEKYIMTKDYHTDPNPDSHKFFLF